MTTRCGTCGTYGGHKSWCCEPVTVRGVGASIVKRSDLLPRGDEALVSPSTCCGKYLGHSSVCLKRYEPAGDIAACRAVNVVSRHVERFWTKDPGRYTCFTYGRSCRLRPCYSHLPTSRHRNRPRSQKQTTGTLYFLTIRACGILLRHAKITYSSRRPRQICLQRQGCARKTGDCACLTHRRCCKLLKRRLPSARSLAKRRPWRSKSQTGTPKESANWTALEAGSESFSMKVTKC